MNGWYEQAESRMPHAGRAGPVPRRRRHPDVHRAPGGGLGGPSGDGHRGGFATVAGSTANARYDGCPRRRGGDRALGHPQGYGEPGEEVRLLGVQIGHVPQRLVTHHVVRLVEMEVAEIGEATEEVFLDDQGPNLADADVGALFAG